MERPIDSNLSGNQVSDTGPSWPLVFLCFFFCFFFFLGGWGGVLFLLLFGQILIEV